ELGVQSSGPGVCGNASDLCTIQRRQSKSGLAILDTQRCGHGHNVHGCAGYKWPCVSVFDHLGHDSVIHWVGMQDGQELGPRVSSLAKGCCKTPDFSNSVG